jgi:hypothetical protein
MPQLEAASDQFLDGYVNDVGEVFHPGRRQPYCCREHYLAALIEALHAEILANDLHMTTPRTGLVILCQSVRNDEHSLIVSNVLHNATRYVPESDEVTKPLKPLQQHEKT